MLIFAVTSILLSYAVSGVAGGDTNKKVNVLFVAVDVCSNTLG